MEPARGAAWEDREKPTEPASSHARPRRHARPNGSRPDIAEGAPRPPPRAEGDWRASVRNTPPPLTYFLRATTGVGSPRSSFVGRADEPPSLAWTPRRCYPSRPPPRARSAPAGRVRGDARRSCRPRSGLRARRGREASAALSASPDAPDDAWTRPFAPLQISPTRSCPPSSPPSRARARRRHALRPRRRRDVPELEPRGARARALARHGAQALRVQPRHRPRLRPPPGRRDEPRDKAAAAAASREAPIDYARGRWWRAVARATKYRVTVHHDASDDPHADSSARLLPRGRRPPRFLSPPDDDDDRYLDDDATDPTHLLPFIPPRLGRVLALERRPPPGALPAAPFATAAVLITTGRSSASRRRRATPRRESPTTR